MSEKTIHRAVCDYIRNQYPSVMFNSDMSGATKLTIGQAVALKNLRSNRGYPDIVIYEPRGGLHGLFIELKDEGVKLWNKSGQPATPHIAEQSECLFKLDKRGYAVAFAIGFDDAKRIIDEYLKL